MHLKGALLQGRFLALPTNISLGWKGLSGANALGYFEHSKSLITLRPSLKVL
jgi:hypothetical protein